MPLLAVISTFTNVAGLYLITKSMTDQTSYFHSQKDSSKYGTSSGKLTFLFFFVGLMFIFNCLILINGVVLSQAGIPERNWQVISSLLLGAITCLAYTAVKIQSLDHVRQQFIY